MNYMYVCTSLLSITQLSSISICSNLFIICQWLVPLIVPLVPDRLLARVSVFSTSCSNNLLFTFVCLSAHREIFTILVVIAFDLCSGWSFKPLMWLVTPGGTLSINSK